MAHESEVDSGSRLDWQNRRKRTAPRGVMSTGSKSNYDKNPLVPVSSSRSGCDVSWGAIAQRLKSKVRPGRFVLCVECYPGCFEGEIERELAAALNPAI